MMTTIPDDELAELERLDKARTQRNRDAAANALPRLIAELRELREQIAAARAMMVLSSALKQEETQSHD